MRVVAIEGETEGDIRVVADYRDLVIQQRRRGRWWPVLRVEIQQAVDAFEAEYLESLTAVAEGEDKGL